jgi:membrane protease YdiL (CAAX protease family)
MAPLRSPRPYRRRQWQSRFFPAKSTLMDPIPATQSALDEGPAAATTAGGRRSRFADVPWRCRDVVFGLLPIVFLQIWKGPRPGASAWLYLALIVLFMGWVLAFPLWTAYRRAEQWSWRPPRIGRVLVEAVWAIPLTLGVILIVVLVMWLLTVAGGEAFSTKDVLENARQAVELPAAYIVFLILGCTLGPVGEEIFMRGFLYNALKRWLWRPAALVLQAVVFAAIHVQPFGNTVAISFIGLFLGLIYEWRKTLLTPIFVHMLVNTLTIGIVVIEVAMNAHAPMLGVGCHDRPDEAGCAITDIVPGSAAEEAQLQVGDVIVGVNGEEVTNFRRLTEMIRSREVGDRVTIQFYRDGVLTETTATLRRRE